MTVTLLQPFASSPTLDDLLDRAREGRHRLSPWESAQALSAGALLVDVRAHAVRRAEGEIEGALVLDRNVLEWRLDPRSTGSLPEASYDRTVVVVCSEGRASSLAVATLQSLGLTRATDLEGGFRAWQATGLPTVPGGTPEGERSRARWLHVDPERWEVRVNGELVHLTAREFRAISALFEADGRVVRRTGLSGALDIYPADSRALDVHVCRLRRKLGPAGRQLVTVRTVGWRLLSP